MNDPIKITLSKPRPRYYAICPICRNPVRLSDGRLKLHVTGTSKCSGTGRQVHRAEWHPFG